MGGALFLSKEELRLGASYGEILLAMSLRLKDQPLGERPRERLIQHGPDALGHAELVAILLRTGYKGATAVDVAKTMLAQFGSLTALAKATVDELARIKGVGRDKAVTLVAAFALARKMSAELRWESPVLDCPEAVVKLLREENLLRDVETLQALLLNTRRRLIRVHEIARGTLDAILVHPREVFKPAIAAQASAIILVHNHPSGDPSPSEADIVVTRKLVAAGQVLDIPVLDHIIIGCASTQRQKDFVSLRALGMDIFD